MDIKMEWSITNIILQLWIQETELIISFNRMTIWINRNKIISIIFIICHYFISIWIFNIISSPSIPFSILNIINQPLSTIRTWPMTYRFFTRTLTTYIWFLTCNCTWMFIIFRQFTIYQKIIWYTCSIYWSTPSICNRYNIIYILFNTVKIYSLTSSRKRTFSIFNIKPLIRIQTISRIFKFTPSRFWNSCSFFTFCTERFTCYLIYKHCQIHICYMFYSITISIFITCFCTPTSTFYIMRICNSISCQEHIKRRL